jgi:serine/threonine protein kinase
VHPLGENVASGMSELARLAIVHRDLAARNVLLDPWLRAKVGDFGLAREGDYSNETATFPVRWTAPEAITRRMFTTKSDVWSFAVVMWEILSFGDNPYHGMSTRQKCQKKLNFKKNSKYFKFSRIFPKFSNLSKNQKKIKIF